MMSSSSSRIPTPTRKTGAPSMRWPKMRPRFVVELHCGADHVMDALRAAASASALEVETDLSARHGVLTVPADERHFWSTQLGLTVEDGRPGPDGVRRATRVLGVFSPHPDVWTAYVFMIGTLVLAGVFSGLVAIVQLLIGHEPWALLGTLIAALAAGLVYTTTLVGQGLAADEMYRLRSHLDDCLERAEERARREPASARESAQL